MTEPAQTSQPAQPVVSAMHRIFTAIAIIGVPGSGKTTLAYSFARYLWETYGRILLLYSWDGGAIPTDVQKGMKQGIIRFWRARTRSGEGLDLETLYLATRGYWPEKIDPETGECSPACRLVPPLSVSYQITCAAGHDLRTVPSVALVQPMYCATCQTMQNEAQLRVKETVKRTKGFELVGGAWFDGLTSMTNVVMDHMDHQRGAGQIGGEKPAFGGVVTSGVIKLGGNNRADVGFGQSRGRQFVDNTLGIPGLVEGPVFTALTNEATDEGGLPILGMKLPGQAATDESIGWFGNVFEQGRYIDDAGKTHFCLYLRPFTDAQNRRHLLKTSSSPEGTPFALPPKLVDPALGEGAPLSIANLGAVCRMLDEDLRHALTDELPGAPGLVPGIMEYGDALTATPIPQAPAGVAVPAAGTMPLATPAALTPTPGADAPSPNMGSVSAPRVTPRARKSSAAPVAPPPQTPALPLAAPAPVAPTPPAPTPAPAATVAPGASLAPPAAAAPSGTAPPPPPGARPPQRAPGT